MVLASQLFRTSLRSPMALLMVMTVALCSMVTPARAQALPDVLSQAAPNAEIIVVVPNMAATSKKISQFMEAIGFKDVPEMADPLGSLKQELGLDKGFNEKGAMLISVSGVLKAAQFGEEPELALLIPVTDYKAFIGNFEGAEENGIATLTMPQGMPGYSRKLGDYCLMGPNKDVIANYKAAGSKDVIGKAVGLVGGRHLATNDLSIIINMKAMGSQLRPLLKEAHDEAKGQMAEFADEDGPMAQAMAMSKGMLATMFDSLDAILRDGDSIVFGSDLSTKGVGFTATAQFREGTALAKMFPGGKGGAADLMAMLPNNPYLMAYAMDMQGIDFQTMVNEFAKRFPKDNWFADIVKNSASLMPQTKRVASVYYAPANAASLMTGMSTVTVIDTTNGANFTKATKGYYDQMSKIKMNLGEIEGMNLNFGFTTTYKENALSPEAAANVGAKVDEYVVKLDLPKDLMAQMGDGAGMIGMMLRTAGYVATVDNTVMMTTTVDTNLLKVGVEAIKKKNGLATTAHVKQVREAGLPANANFEAYVNVGSITQLFNQFSALAQMFQIPEMPEIPQIEVPNNLPPIAMGGQVEAGGMSARFYVPMPVINWVKDTAMKFQGGDGDAPVRPGAQPAPF